jgi:prophage regulatory protein
MPRTSATVHTFNLNSTPTATARINLPPQLETACLLRLPQVLAVFPISKTSWYAGIAAGKFPKPIKLGSRTSAWKSEDIRVLVESMGTL